jgi:hypothetical protein
MCMHHFNFFLESHFSNKSFSSLLGDQTHIQPLETWFLRDLILDLIDRSLNQH